MNLLLCAATDFEIKCTLDFLKQHPVLKDKVEVLITGVGLTSATYQLTRQIITRRPHFVLQAGICGSLDESLEPGEIVMVEKESIGDLGVMESGAFQTLFHLGLVQKNEPPWINGKLCNDLLVLRKTNLKIVDGVTINEITTSPDRISVYSSVLEANIETMEGAALHYVCLMEKIPFLQIRSVSNYVGERDKSKWALQKAIVNLNIELERIILKLFHL
jgi:futalosine hydrolase